MLQAISSLKTMLLKAWGNNKAIGKSLRTERKQKGTAPLFVTLEHWCIELQALI